MKKRIAALLGLVVVALALFVALRGGRDGRSAALPTSEDLAPPSEAGSPLEAYLAEQAAHLPERGRHQDTWHLELAPPAAPPEPSATTADGLRFRIEGRVLTQDDQPIEGAEVFFAEERLAAVTDADGLLAGEVELPQRLVTRLDFGQELRVCADGYAEVRLPATIQAGQTTRLGVVRLAPGGEVSGQVLDERDEPVFDAHISWRPALALPIDTQEAHRVGVDNPSPSAETWTGSDGTFRLRGVPAGTGFLVGGARGMYYGWTKLFSVRSGIPLVQDLTLESKPDAWKLTCRVLLPDGGPLPRAQVRIDSRTGFPGYSIHDTDDAGRLLISLEGDETRQVVAFDPEYRWYPARIEAVEPRDQVLELVLGEPDWLEVLVADPDGDPIPWSHVRCSVGRTQQPLEATGELGARTILRPRRPFSLQAFAPGFRTETFGPFAPEDVDDLGGEPLVLRLTSGHSVRGRVMFQGRPVRGARIGVSPSSARDQVLLSRGVTPLEHPFRTRATVDVQQHDADTDDAGRFLATLHRDGWHSVLVRAPGLPLTVFGPFEWSQDVGVDGLELELLAGGAIEGRVLIPAGSRAAGRLVGVSSGWNFVRSTTVREDGSFRIDDLAPGDYQVRPLEPPVASLQDYSIRRLETPSELTWDCRVRPGETTRFDLDLTSQGSVVLAGRFTWEGAPLGGGSVRLCTRDSDEPLAYAELDVDGRFELALSRAGPMTLRFWLTDGRFTQSVDLVPGRQAWNARVPFGTLRFRGDFSGFDYSDGLLIEYTWENDDGLRSSGRIHPLWQEPGEDILLERIPAGTLHLKRGGEAWRDVEITAGEETVVDVPSDR